MKLYLAAITVAIILVFWGFKGAQSGETEAGASVDPVVVVVNKARILRLDGEADVVLVANPEIADVVIDSPTADVVIDSPTLLFVLGLTAGETSLLVLDEERNEILVTVIRVVSTEARASLPNQEPDVTRVKLLRRTEQTTLECTPRCLEGEGNIGSPQVAGPP